MFSKEETQKSNDRRIEKKEKENFLGYVHVKM